MVAPTTIAMVEKRRKFPPGCGCSNVFSFTDEMKAPPTTTIVMVEKPRKFPPGCGPNAPRTSAPLNRCLEQSGGKLKDAREAAVSLPLSRGTPVFPEKHRYRSNDFRSNHVRAVEVERSRVNLGESSEQIGGGGMIPNPYPVKNSTPQINTTRECHIISVERGGDTFPTPGKFRATQFGKSCSKNVQRNAVMEKLKQFRSKCDHLSRTETRPEMAAWRELKCEGKIKHLHKPQIGTIPGIEIGDTFLYRIELVITSLHTQLIRGIDYTYYHSTIVATSVVSTDGYMDRMKTADFMSYIGEGCGGVSVKKNSSRKKKYQSDQKLKGGNLALRNSMQMGLPVRVIRGVKKSLVSRASYIYCGLYLVTNCVKKKLRMGNLVYEFELRRLPHQPPVIAK